MVSKAASSTAWSSISRKTSSALRRMMVSLASTITVLSPAVVTCAAGAIPNGRAVDSARLTVPVVPSEQAAAASNISESGSRRVFMRPPHVRGTDPSTGKRRTSCVNGELVAGQGDTQCEETLNVHRSGAGWLETMQLGEQRLQGADLIGRAE